MTWRGSRREWLAANGGLMVGSGLTRPLLGGQHETTATTRSGIEVRMPRDRVPLSFIIDDSTCLVNMGHFCTPQFAACYPNRAEYQKDWRQWPREIPDSFVREFGQWCAAHDVKGKYSIVPNPACVGWLDRALPGWSRKELLASLDLVRELMLPNWDIHPEMITHTRVIDLKTGRPREEISPATMENSYPQQDLSVDQLAEYLAYALRILKNCGLPCEGITTPGGFGNRVKEKLPLAVRQAVSDVFAAEIPHYFKYVEMGEANTEPRVEALATHDGSPPHLTVNVPAGTGDWFGGWQGDRLSEPDRYANADASSGRMVELIERGQPAVMLCHWPGIYSNGTRDGFRAFQRIVRTLRAYYGERTQWMKLSQMARYWATKELAELTWSDEQNLRIDSPFACPQFTLQCATTTPQAITLRAADQPVALKRVDQPHRLDSGTYFVGRDKTLICIDLPAGTAQLTFSAAGSSSGVSLPAEQRPEIP
jgi:hypothetical protein